MKIYNKEGNDIQSQLIKQLMYQISNYIYGCLNIWGTDEKGDDIFEYIYFYLIDYIDINNNALTIKHINGKPKTIINPKILVTREKINCTYYCLYFCKTGRHEAEYYEDESYDYGFCMINGEEICYGSGIPCKFFKRKNEKEYIY